MRNIAAEKTRRRVGWVFVALTVAFGFAYVYAVMSGRTGVFTGWLLFLPFSTSCAMACVFFGVRAPTALTAAIALVRDVALELTRRRAD